MNLLETALYWKKMGIATIPIQYRDKRPDGARLPKDENGEPIWEPFKTQLPTDDQLKMWFAGRLHNLAIITGWKNLVVVDFDSYDYATWRLWVTRQNKFTRWVIDNTYQVRSSRGVHFYFTLPHPEQSKKLKGIDIKASGGYVLAPPSIHPSGMEYREMIPGASPLAISALSDILPAAFLVQNVQLPPDVVIPGRTAAPQKILSDDPWDTAQSVGQPSDDLVTEIRETFRIEDFFPTAEKTSSNGRWMMAKCPFHTDKHPSFWIDTQRQICACYSGCTPKPLDSINLYARLHGMSNLEAIFALSKMLD